MNDVLTTESVQLGARAATKDEALAQSGALLVGLGAVTQDYADALFEREKQVSTYLGEGFAIPHGTNESRIHIRRTALGFIQYPEGVDWDGQRVHVAIPIASNSDDHVEILGALAEVLMDPEAAEKLRTSSSVDEVLALLGGIRQEG